MSLDYQVPSGYQKIAIIGGGDMGKPLAQKLICIGHQVALTEPLQTEHLDNPDYMALVRAKNTDLAEQANVIILALGMREMCCENVEHIFSHASVAKRRLVSDMTSVKGRPQKMLRLLEGARLGLTHPLFRLNTEAPLGQRNLVICPDDTMTDADEDFLRTLWQTIGPRIHTMEVDEHDKAMSVIQAESHLAFLFPEFVRASAGLAPLSERKYGTQREHWLANILGNTPSVIAGIAELNEYRLQSLQTIIKKIRERISHGVEGMPEQSHFSPEQISAADDIDTIALYFPDIPMPSFGLKWDDIRHLHTDISAARVRMARTVRNTEPADFLDERFDTIPRQSFQIALQHLLEIERLIKEQNFIEVIQKVGEHRQDIMQKISKSQAA